MLSRVLALLTFLVILTSSRSTPLPANEKSETRDFDYRLPENIVPEAYRIRIIPDYPESGEILGSKTFSGEVIIDAKVVTATNKITFHKGPTIEEVVVICVIDTTSEESGEEENESPPSIANVCSAGDGYLFEPTGTEEETETEKFSILFENNIPSDTKIRIVLKYFAEYPEGGLTGFYVSTYEIEGKEVALLTSKFEPTHARKAFPCFDEPALKATFKLFVAIKEDINAISNTPESYRNVDETIVGFEKTPAMSTYLLAFIVFERENFVQSDEKMRPGSTIEFSTWGRKNMIEQVKGGQLSQVEGPAALEFLEEYTGIKYTETMKKMDMAAVPDFQSGAMENWGLVTYRENALLFNQQTGTTANHKRVVDVIDHELSHMWFGNLVTTEWWSSIWLNEGFASYVQYLVAHHRYPKWHMLERFVLDEHMYVMGVDADLSSPPLTDESVLSPEEIGNHFGTVSYSKGGAILRQIENVIGEEKFILAVQKYLRENFLQAAKPENLFDQLVEYNENSISLLDDGEFRGVLESWTEKSGYPLITVTREGNIFHVAQERFLLNPGEETNSDRYPVYLTWTTTGEENTVTAPKAPQAWLLETDASKDIEINDADENTAVLFNAYQGGYYRVNYDDATWTLIGRILDNADNLDRVSAIDRAALVDNVLALARAGAITYERALRLLRFLRHDTAFEPWAAARTALAHLQRMLGAQQPFKDFIAYIVEKAYNETGFDHRFDDHILKVHRTNILSLACSAGYERCRQEAKERLEKYLAEVSVSVDPDLESVVFCYGLKGASSETWERLWAEYATSDAARRSTLITALGCIDHRATLEKFLLKSIQTSEVRAQDAYTVFSSVYGNTDGGAEVALDFLTFIGYDKLDQKYGAVRNAMSTLISGLANRLATERDKNQLEEAVKAYGTKHASAVRAVQSNIDWLEEHDVSVLKVLDETRDFSYSGAGKAIFAYTLAMLCAGLLVLLR